MKWLIAASTRRVTEGKQKRDRPVQRVVIHIPYHLNVLSTRLAHMHIKKGAVETNKHPYFNNGWG